MLRKIRQHKTEIVKTPVYYLSISHRNSPGSSYGYQYNHSHEMWRKRGKTKAAQQHTAKAAAVNGFLPINQQNFFKK